MSYPLGMKEQVRQKALTLSAEKGIVSNEFIIKKTQQLYLETKQKTGNNYLIYLREEGTQTYNLKFSIFFLKHLTH